MPPPREMLAGHRHRGTLNFYRRLEQARLVDAEAVAFAVPNRALRVVAVQARKRGRGHPVRIVVVGCGVHHTTFEALAVGSLVATPPGAFLRSRISGGLYTKMAGSEPLDATPAPLAGSDDYYAGLAVELAHGGFFECKASPQIGSGRSGHRPD